MEKLSELMPIVVLEECAPSVVGVNV